MKQLLKFAVILQLWRDKRGQDLIEYALMAGFVAVAAGAARRAGPDRLLDNADVERVSGALMQDLQRTCSCCDSRSTCAKELAAQPDADDWKAYCPNVVSLESLQKLKGRFPA